MVSEWKAVENVWVWLDCYLLESEPEWPSVSFPNSRYLFWKWSAEFVQDGEEGSAWLTRDAGNETGSNWKLCMRLSCSLDFCKDIARFRISSFASGLMSSISLESSALLFLADSFFEAEISCTPLTKRTPDDPALSFESVEVSISGFPRRSCGI